MPRPHDETIQRFREAERLVEQLGELLPPALILETARVMALHLAHYQRLHGEIPLEESLQVQQGLSGEAGLTDEALSLAAEGLESLAGMLGIVLDQQDGDIEVH